MNSKEKINWFQAASLVVISKQLFLVSWSEFLVFVVLKRPLLTCQDTKKTCHDLHRHLISGVPKPYFETHLQRTASGHSALSRSVHERCCCWQPHSGPFMFSPAFLLLLHFDQHYSLTLSVQPLRSECLIYLLVAFSGNHRGGNLGKLLYAVLSVCSVFDFLRKLREKCQGSHATRKIWGNGNFSKRWTPFLQTKRKSLESTEKFWTWWTCRSLRWWRERTFVVSNTTEISLRKLLERGLQFLSVQKARTLTTFLLQLRSTNVQISWSFLSMPCKWEHVRSDVYWQEHRSNCCSADDRTATQLLWLLNQLDWTFYWVWLNKILWRNWCFLRILRNPLSETERSALARFEQLVKSPRAVFGCVWEIWRFWSLENKLYFLPYWPFLSFF